MSTERSVSAIVRTKDSAATLMATITSLRAQEEPVEIVVVDSGSHDSTLAVAHRHADRVVEIPPSTFTYGGSLNTGCAAASGALLLALSSHCALPDAEWVTRALVLFEQHPTAVAACGSLADERGAPLTAPAIADHRRLITSPWWGLSNHASVWRRSAWESCHFDPTLYANEDKEWAWRATANDGVVVLDPSLMVEGGHRRAAGTRAYYRRMVKEVSALSHLAPPPPFPLRRALSEWCTRTPTDPYLSSARPFGRTRGIEVLARYRAVSRSRGNA